MINKRTAEFVYTHSPEISKAAVDLHYRKVPELNARFGAAGKEKCLQDARYHLAYLAEAIISESPLLFKDYVNWAQQMLQSRNVPAADLANLSREPRPLRRAIQGTHVE